VQHVHAIASVSNIDSFTRVRKNRTTEQGGMCVAKKRLDHKMKARTLPHRSSRTLLSRLLLLGATIGGVGLVGACSTAANEEEAVGSTESGITACTAVAATPPLPPGAFETDGTPYPLDNIYARNAFSYAGEEEGIVIDAREVNVAALIELGVSIQELKDLGGWKFLKTIRNKGTNKIEIAPGVWVGCSSILRVQDDKGAIKYVKLDGGKCAELDPENDAARWEGFWNGRWGDNLVACAVSKIEDPSIEGAKTKWYQDGIKLTNATIAVPLIVQDSIDFTDIIEMAWGDCSKTFPLMGPKPSNHTLSDAELKALVARIKALLEDPKYNGAAGAEVILRRMFSNRDSNGANIFFKLVDGKIVPILVTADNGAALTGWDSVMVPDGRGGKIKVEIVDITKPHIFLPGDASKKVYYTVDWSLVGKQFPKLLEWLDKIAKAKTLDELNDLLCGMLPPTGPNGPAGRPSNKKLLEGMQKRAQEMLAFLKTKGVKVAAADGVDAGSDTTFVSVDVFALDAGVLLYSSDTDTARFDAAAAH
jgi:hypothetical protein